MKRLLLILLLTAHAAVSQSIDSTITDVPPPPNYRFSFISNLGMIFQYTRLPAMQEFLRNNRGDYGGFGGLALTIEYGIRIHRLQFLLRDWYSVALTPMDDPYSLNTSRLQASHGFRTADLTVGYDLIDTRNRRLFLNVGAGVSFHQISLYRPVNQTVSFQNMLNNNPAPSAPDLRNNLPFVDVNLEYAQREKRRRGAGNSLRIGYRRQLQTQPWSSAAYNLTDSPQERFGQVYFQALIRLSINNNKFRFRE